MILSTLLKDFDYKIDLFANYIQQIENSIITKEAKDGTSYYKIGSANE